MARRSQWDPFAALHGVGVSAIGGREIRAGTPARNRRCGWRVNAREIVFVRMICDGEIVCRKQR